METANTHHGGTEARRKPKIKQVDSLAFWLSLCLCVSVVSPLFAQQTATTTLAPVKTKLILLTQQTCAAVAGVANQSLICYDVSGAIEENVNNTGWVPFVGGACSNCVVTDGSGNATIAGDFTALELILSGSGPLDVTTPCNTVSAPPGGFGLLGMGAGCVPVIYPSSLSAVVPIAYQDGFGNVYQNANTATALAATPAQCSGQYALGITANGTANCSTSTYVLIPEIAAPSGVSGYGIWYIDSTSHEPEFIDPSFNSGAAIPPLFKTGVYLTWSCPIAGGSLIPSTGTSQYCNWTLPAGITVVAYDLAVSILPAGCSTYPVVQVWDGTAGTEVGSYSLTLSSSNSFLTQVTGSSAVAATHQLRMKVTTAPVGCNSSNTVTGSNVIATVTYQMQ